MKKLVYYNVGFNSNYNKLLELSLISLKMNYDGDILIITDYENSLLLKENINLYDDVKFMIVEKPPDVFIAALNRVRIYDYIDFDYYDVILYLDCDTVIINSLDNIFNETIKNGCVAISQEKYKNGRPMFMIELLNLEPILTKNKEYIYMANYWGLFLYDKNEDKIEDKIALNSGVFCLPATKKSKDIFEELYNRAISDHKNINYIKNNIDYGEQPYINYFLQKHSYFFCIDDVYFVYSNKDDEITSKSNLIKDYEIFNKYINDYAILHFIGPEWGSFELKYKRIFNIFPNKIKNKI
jgi:lipopolysaccharide biosynthesis glycosyltransferase